MNERVFRNPSCAGIYYTSKEQAGPATVAARDAGLKVLKADIGDRKNLLSELGRAWKFPEWYGANFDALHDCLTDENWLSPTGCVLIAVGLGALHAANAGDFETLMDVFRSAVQINLESRTPLWILVDTAAPGIPPLPEA